MRVMIKRVLSLLMVAAFLTFVPSTMRMAHATTVTHGHDYYVDHEEGPDGKPVATDSQDEDKQPATDSKDEDKQSATDSEQKTNENGMTEKARKHRPGKHKAKKPVKQEEAFPSTKETGVTFDATGKGSLDGKLIILDPGHGGQDSGATVGNDMEKNINLSVALKLKDLLTARGAKVVMTRSTDIFIPLDDRAGLSNKLKPNVFLSIHTNAAEKDNPSIHGVETYYWSADSQAFAQALFDSLVKDLNEQANWVKKNNLRVLDRNSRIAALSEMGYLTNPASRALLVRNDYQDKIALALCEGIENYEKAHP
jgi:N-acetylmuramoyl-L-alanine amidase